jgi:hypothetical protein
MSDRKAAGTHRRFGRGGLEHVPEKSTDFSDKNMFLILSFFFSFG